ncbi:protein FAM3C isoform X3 [Danio aesculapii]|uniref:protein FAM3C isoform X3 n=1 Tax=Danio aesculapii TaxID=1142201 RepID=UPI0024BF494E|nr:protein FAM3C isoform X3 [Danio aesculapii]
MIYVRREKLKFILMVAAFIISIGLVLKLLQINPEVTFSNLIERSVDEMHLVSSKPDKKIMEIKPDVPKAKCGLAKPCPAGGLAFKMYSGATNIVGPQICFDGKMLIQKETRGNWQGINIVVINEETGEHVKTGSFNMWTGKVEELIEFLNSIEDGSFVLIATFDDPSTKLNDEARALLAGLGSAFISKVGFRDNWIFVGGKKTLARVYFEQHMKNDRDTNKYDGWPEMIEMEGCIPRLR